jgi:ABC-2 type transport system permease protein
MYENIDQLRNIDKSFRKGSIKEVIIYEKDFTRKLEAEGTASIQIIADASEPNTANLIVNYTSGIIASYNKDLNKTAQQPDFIKSEVRMYYNAEMKGVFMFVPGLMALLLTLISALMTSISITREKELGTMEVLLVSPLKPIQIIIGKVMPYVAMSFINAAMILLIANLIFEVPVRGSVVLLLAECLLYILVALSLGILISTSTNSQQIAMLMSMVGLMLPAILLSGFIFPIENMPVVLQWVCQIMPPRWFISIIKAIMLKGVGFSYVWKETLVLVFMMVVFIGLSVKKFKVRLE